MARNVLIYWVGILGIPGKGPNNIELYDGNKTLADIAAVLLKLRMNNKKDINFPQIQNGKVHPTASYPLNMKLSEYLALHPILIDNKDLMVVYA